MSCHIVTFGSNHLPQYNVNSLDVMLIIEGTSEDHVREQIEKDGGLNIGDQYAFIYSMSEAQRLQDEYSMRLFTKEQLLNTKRDPLEERELEEWEL